MIKSIRKLARLTVAHHFWGSLAIVSFVIVVIGAQMGDRHNFANSELYEDVIDRWGAPISQAAPSVRFVPSGSVFNTLGALPLDHQTVRVDATMNYRKRGLVYFSGFDFAFDGNYRVTNPDDRDVDIVFVFPLSAAKTQILLSDLEFLVDDQPHQVDLSEGDDKLVWSGRLPAGASAGFRIRFRGRGLDRFVYRIDPALPVNNLDVAFTVGGGINFDYPADVIPATDVQVDENAFAIGWKYGALESGVPVGITLPSEKSFDAIVVTMLRRAWAPFVLLFAGITFLGMAVRRRLEIYEAYLIAAAYGFSFVLIAYFGAFMNFYIAYGLAMAIIVPLLFAYVSRILNGEVNRSVLGLVLATLVVPTTAVILQGYTGLIYALEILVGLVVLMKLTTGTGFAHLYSKIEASATRQPDAPTAL